MTDPESSRKAAPDITEEVDRKLDAISTNDKLNDQQIGQNKAGPIQPSQREPRPFHEIVDYSKLQFGQKLIAWCIFLIVVLSIIGYFWNGADGDGKGLSEAIELLKLVTTTALGFVFAKTQNSAAQTRQKDGQYKED